MTITSPRRQAATLIAATLLPLLLATACGDGDPDPVAADDASATTSPSTTTTADTTPATPEATAGSEPVELSPLEGAWQAGPVTIDQTVATLRRHGLEEWIDDYRANAPFQDDTLLTLTVQSGAWDLYGSSDGGQPEPIDYDAEYEIDGDTVTFHHSDGSTTYRWRVERDSLTLRWASSTMPAYQGIPDEVFQRALYMTATFTRA